MGVIQCPFCKKTDTFRVKEYRPPICDSRGYDTYAFITEMRGCNDRMCLFEAVFRFSKDGVTTNVRKII